MTLRTVIVFSQSPLPSWFSSTKCPLTGPPDDTRVHLSTCSFDAKACNIYVYENKQLYATLQQRDWQMRKLLLIKREYSFPTQARMSPGRFYTCTRNSANQCTFSPGPEKAMPRTKLCRSSVACSEPDIAETANRDTISGRPAKRDSACVSLTT